MRSEPCLVSSAPGSAAGRDELVSAAKVRPGSGCTCACTASRSRDDTNALSGSTRGAAAPRRTLVSMPARGHLPTRRADASGAQAVSAVPAMPTSVTRARLPATFAWIAVPTVLRASGEPLGIRTWGVRERRVLGVRLTAAAASAGEPGAGVPVPICPKDRLKGAVPMVVNVSPRMGDVSAEPANGPARKTAGSDWSPSRDATEASSRSRTGSSSTRLVTRGPLPSSNRVRVGNARPRSVAGLGLTASKLIREATVPEPSEATVVEILASCAAARTGGTSAYRAKAATSVDRGDRSWSVSGFAETRRSYRSSTSSHHPGKGGERPTMVAVRI